MTTNSLNNIILEVLKQDDRLWNEETTEYNRLLLFDLLEKYDEVLIKLFLENNELKKRFFIDLNGVFVFKNRDFKFFMEENKINNSYTQYINQIGLTNNHNFIKNYNEVVLDFPFKDCILQGGQTKEDQKDVYYEYDEKINKTQKKKGYKEKSYNKRESKRNEIFFNEILAQDEIDRLFDVKAFSNWKRYTEKGVIEVEHLERDELGLLKENFIIKGNNLIALKSINEQFSKKVKLIYLDPPYNTGQDGFDYNDKFTRATWLTFMKNRLEVAKDFLRDDGYIAIQINDKNSHYLKILMDEIFGEENFINNIIVKMSEVSGVKMKHVKNRMPKVKEHIFLYKMENSILNPIKINREKWDEEYRILLKNFTKSDKDKIDSAMAKSQEGEELTFEEVKNLDKILENTEIGNADTEINRLGIPKEEREDWLKNNAYRICRSVASPSVKKLADEKRKKTDNLLFCVVSSRDKIPYIVKSDYSPESSSPRVQLIFAEDQLQTYLGDIWTDINTTGLEAEGTVKFKNGKKPEKLIKRIIEMTTSESDIVMDFFLGSGTTSAVAHKMNRQYIGIEQLDYEENDATQRIQNIINGESSGISNEVGWEKGGEFVYFEIAKFNQQAKEEIEACSNIEELRDLFTTLCDKYFLHYNVKVDDFKNSLMYKKEFEDLALNNQKNMVKSMLDLNQLYIHKTEMTDTKYDLNKSDQELTELFYERGK